MGSTRSRSPDELTEVFDALVMAGATTVIDYEYLAPDAAGRAQLWITPQPGWQRVRPEQLPRY